MKAGSAMTESTIRDEIKRNLLGGLEVALFMPVARKRFGDTADEAVRSFAIPLLLFPLTLLAFYIYPKEEIARHSADMISIMYALRMAAMWLLFFGTVYWIAKEVDRKKYFYQFVIASNWLTLPATIIFLPVAWMLISGAYGWNELYPFMTCLMIYTYVFTAFMATRILRIPWELAGFIVFLNICISNSTLDILFWVGGRL